MFKPIEKTSLSVIPTEQQPTFYNATVAGLSDCYILYEVWHGTPAVLLYLGVCKLSMIATMPDAQANSEFMRLVARDAIITVRIIATGTRADCLNYRTRIARDMPEMPPCNKRGTVGRFSGIQCIDDGVTYRTQAEAARAYGITQSSISNHMRGAPGYGTVGGRTFRRVAL